jgi:hypothetical protein
MSFGALPSGFNWMEATWETVAAKRSLFDGLIAWAI